MADRLFPLFVGGDVNGEPVWRPELAAGIPAEIHVPKPSRIALPEGAIPPSIRYKLHVMKLHPDWPGMLVYSHEDMSSEESSREVWNILTRFGLPLQEENNV